MGSWSGTLPSKQAERLHFRTTVDIALPIMQAGQRDGPGIESHGPARLIQDRQRPTFRATADTAPHHPE